MGIIYKSYTVLTLLVLPLCLCFADEVDYPTAYRNWNHVKSGIVDQKHPLFEAFGGMHHIYANAPALQALKANSEYPDDAVFVFDLMYAVPFDGGIIEGERRRIDVMVKNKIKYANTGGWGFESFKGSTQQRVMQNVTEKCYSCHEAKTDTDYVFSVYRN